MTTAQFNGHIDFYVQALTAWAHISREVAKQGAGDKLVYTAPSGATYEYGRSELARALAEIRRGLEKSKAYFRASLSSRKSTGRILSADERAANAVNAYDVFVAAMAPRGLSIAIASGLMARQMVMAKTKSGRSDQLQNLIYISDQLAGFFAASNYGCGFLYLFPEIFAANPDYARIAPTNGDAIGLIRQVYPTAGELNAVINAKARALGYTGAPLLADADLNGWADVHTGLDLVVNRRMATSSILVSLFALINAVGQLQSVSFGQRIHYNGEMLAAFGPGTNTRPTLFGQDLLQSPAGAAAAAADPTFVAKYQDANASAFDRLRARTTKVNKNGVVEAVKIPSFIAEQNAAPGTDNWGIPYSCIMVMFSYFRIPNELLSAAQLAAITQVKGGAVNGNVAESQATQEYIKLLLDGHKVLNAPAKKARAKAKAAAH